MGYIDDMMKGMKQIYGSFANYVKYELRVGLPYSSLELEGYSGNNLSGINLSGINTAFNDGLFGIIMNSKREKCGKRIKPKKKQKKKKKKNKVKIVPQKKRRIHRS